MQCSANPEKPRHCRTAPAQGTRLQNAAVLLVLFVAVPQVQAQTRKSADINFSRLAEAVKVIGQGDLRKAESLLNSVLAESPSDSDALNLLGVVRAHEQKPAEAERLFRRALAASAKNIGAHVNLGKLLLTMNRTSEALQIFRLAHRLAPERAEINLDLATLSADSGDYQRALEYLRLLPRSAGHRRLLPVVLRALLGLNRLEEARGLSREFWGVKP